MRSNESECLRVMRLCPEAELPERATSGSAGLDLHALLTEPLTIEPGQLVSVRTGLAVQLPPDTAGLIFGRSGLGVRHGIALSNGVGVIDSDYRGELVVGLCNHGSLPYTLRPGERMAQLVVVPVYIISVNEAESLDNSIRGEGGFGSTGML